ncbi:MAG: TRAP transporter large permease [Clostridiales Family XIII bacterium]|jgi:tripartite ATP-independent transporter DctM subunit|nr:TRAP transporter large permease [Clostridiales Family XIII bacterium]
MDQNLLIGILGIVLLIILMFLRQWVSVVMLFIGIVGLGIVNGFPNALNIAGTLPYSQAANFSLACIPTFVFMGCMISISGIGADLYDAASKWLSRVRGGLAIATVVACGFFAAICGDSVATAVTFGKVSFPEMRRHGYKSSFAAASIVSGGTIGIMIPPSVGFIIYGILTEQSIGKLFMAGFIPGISQVLFYAVTIYIVCRMRPEYAPTTQSYPFKEKLKSTRLIIPVIVIFLFIMGGIYGGFFSATEAGAMGAVAVLVVGFIMRRLDIKKCGSALQESLLTSGMVFFIIISAFFFLRFITATGLAQKLSEIIIEFQATYNVPSVVIVIIIALFYLITGCFLDALAVILLTLPIIFPIVMALGYDPIWWGVIMVRLLETSMITPPFGLNLFVLSKAINHPLEDIYKGVAPFIVSDVLHITLLIAVPQLSLLLPNMM